jgi:YVTN family beta-propeller protein
MHTRLAVPRRWLIAGTTAAVLAVGVTTAAAADLPLNPFGTSHVGQQTNGRILLPDNQWISPYGHRTTFAAMSVGTAVSPDGTKVAVQTGGGHGTRSIEILDAANDTVLQTFGGAGVAAPVYSPDGTALYAGKSTASSGSQGTGSIVKYTVGPDGRITNPSSPQTIPLAKLEFPYGLAVSSDGTKLYAVLNGTNQLAVIDTAMNQVMGRIPVGNTPQDVAIVGNEAFVSNRGGRPAGTGDTTNKSDGTSIVSDPTTGASTTGTVSVVDLATNTVTDTINVGLQPSSLTVHEGSLFVTNTNSDTVSVIDAASHEVTQTFNVEPLPGSDVGAAPNSVAVTDDQHLLVSVGRDNAIAVFEYHGPRVPMHYQGLIPTDGYPNQVQYDAKLGKLFVSNQEGVSTDGASTTGQVKGTLTSFGMPSNSTLQTLTRQVFDNNGWDHLNVPPGQDSQGEQGKSLPAIPAKLGQPSAIKHLFLIIKENRTYDQVLGDIGKGNGDPTKTSFGAQTTPNEHNLANTFTLFDNFYDNGMVSADGHNWLLQGDNNDYLEQDAATSWGRSYPYPGGDALAYQRDGFLWNTVERAGGTAKNYGEFESHTSGTQGTWQQYYADSQILEGKATGPLPVPIDQRQWSSDVPSLNQISNPLYPHFDVNIPDQYRTDIWEQDFRQAEQTGNLPNLTTMTLGDDHTGGKPTPVAQVADNDLAVGRIVSDISHSQFWKDSAVFVLEDDTQAGSDHVDGHRGPLFIASPYAKRGVVNSDYFSQINVVKTIEQILGAQPMNQMDRAAVPMLSAFTNTPDLTPYDTVPNQIPLTQGVTGLIPLPPTTATAAPSATAAPTAPPGPVAPPAAPSAAPTGSSAPPAAPSATAAPAATNGPPAPPVPAPEQPVAAAWDTWDKTVAQPALSGTNAAPDSVNPAQLNRYGWYSSTGWTKPYPGDQRILPPDQVPGRNLPGDLNGD